MTFVINWRGLHGYGDWVPPATYAHNESVRRDEDVHVIFHVTNKHRKYKSHDKSSKEDMVRFIFDNTDKSDLTKQVTYEMRYDVPYEYIPEPQASNGLDNMYGTHNHRFCNEKWRWNGGKENTVAVVSTALHREKFRDIRYRGSKKVGDKAWKDAWPDRWWEFCERFERLGMRVHHIHYEMSVEEVAEKIQESSIVYGYQAGAVWLAKWQGAPLVLCTHNRQFSEQLLPWSVWYGPDQFDEVHMNMHSDIVESLEKKEKFVHNAELWKHSRPGTFVWQAPMAHYAKRAFPYKSHSSEKVYNEYRRREDIDIQIALEEMRKKFK